MKYFFLVLFFFLCSITFSQNQNPKREFRAAWIATVVNIDWPLSKNNSVELQKENLVNQLDSLADAGMNAVLFQVRTECDALYKSNFEPWSHWLTGEQGKVPEPFYDPLQFAIEESHKRGMELHAWFNPYRAVRDTALYPLDESHVSVKHPEWIIKAKKLKILNPGLPEVRTHILNVVNDVIINYNIDGIHFDDYFYPYEPKISNEDSLTFLNHSRGITNIDDWRRDNINQLMKDIYEIIKAEKPYVKFGISPFGIVRNEFAGTNGFNSFDVIYCDPLNWLDNKIVDYITPQVYWEIGHKLADYSKLVPWWATVATERHLYIGQYSSKMSAPNYDGNKAEIGNQIRLNRSTPNVLGSVYFSAKSITRNWSRLADSMKNNWYSNIALPPVMAWLDSVPPLKPENVHLVKTKSGLLIYWNMPDAAADNEFPNYYLVYKFNSKDEIDLSKSQNIVTKVLNKKTSYFNLNEKKGKSIYVITSVDRLHNESEGVVLEIDK
ncbi:MAG: family 10 glycosylhydrolase [Melioribacteraceae bacterium]|nr:family 10 glycosylhydrolase [Melioribacteraceae bacterium]